MGLYVFIFCISSLSCFRNFWHAILISFPIFNVCLVYTYIYMCICVFTKHTVKPQNKGHVGDRPIVDRLSSSQRFLLESPWRQKITFSLFDDFFNSNKKINCIKNVGYNYDITIQYLSERLIVVLYASRPEYMEASILVYPLVRHGNVCVLGLLSMMRTHFETSLLLYGSEKGQYDKRQS